MTDDDPETEAAHALEVLPCPACGGNYQRMMPKCWIRGVVVECCGCGALVATATAGVRSGWRDAMIGWNVWVMKARRKAQGGGHW